MIPDGVGVVTGPILLDWGAVCAGAASVVDVLLEDAVAGGGAAETVSGI